MENYQYKSWLKQGTTVYSAKNSVWVSEFNVAWGCESAVRSHERGCAHVKNITDLESAKKSLGTLFFEKTPVHSDASSSSASGTCEKLAAPSSQFTTIDELVSQQAFVTKAEMIWVLRLLKNHYSFRSCLELGDDLRDIFPNNDIASNFKLLKAKCAYLVTHGIAPWLKSNLPVEVFNSPFYSESFGESLNVVLQENQMDIQVRFWSEKLKKAVRCYWGSEFQLRSNAETLSDSLMKGVVALPVEKQYQLAVNAPKVNWKILRLIVESRDKEEHPPLQDIGCFGLHVVSGTLHTGVVVSSWPVEKVLRSYFQVSA